MKYFLLFLILCGSAAAQNYRVNPATHTLPRAGTGQYSGWVDQDPPTGALGSAIFGPGADRSVSFPQLPYPHTIYYGFADNPTTSANFVPQYWFRAVPVGSGETSDWGPYDDIEGGWVPTDPEGNPVDPETGEPLPGKHGATFPLENPFPDRPFTYGVGIIDPETGAEIGYDEVTLGPGATMDYNAVMDRPFQYEVYPIVEGVRGSPVGSGGSGFGGTVGAPPSGPPIMTPGPVVTPPLTNLPDAPDDDVQAEVRRLADIVKQSQDSMRTAQNLTNDELVKLNKKQADANTALSNLQAGLGTANDHLASIAGNTSGGGTGGLTQAELEESLGNGAGEGEEPTETEDAEEAADGVLASVAGLRAAMSGVGESMADMVDAAGLGQTYSQESWNYTVVLGDFGSYSVDFSPYTWIFELVRNVTLGMLSLHFMGVYIRTIRGAIV